MFAYSVRYRATGSLTLSLGDCTGILTQIKTQFNLNYMSSAGSLAVYLLYTGDTNKLRLGSTVRKWYSPF